MTIPADETNHRIRTSVEGSEICLHLNGKTYSQKEGYTGQGAILVATGTTMNIMGDGVVKGSGFWVDSVKSCAGGAVDCRGTLNIHGGTYMSIRQTPAVALFNDNSSVNMYAGTIQANPDVAAGDTSALIYMYAATQTFNMQGGEIHSNTSNTHGALILVMKADAPATTMETYTQINISGGKIWGNTSTSGGVVAAVSNHINITGGTITGNNVKKGAVYGRNENNMTVSGAPTIYGNNGGNLYITDKRMLTVGEMTGGKIGIGANKSTIQRIAS